MKEACRYKETMGCEDCQYHAYWGCSRVDASDEGQECGFDKKELCTRKCIYFDTCTRNPNRKGKKRDSERVS